jgi:hypothetical protein
MAAKDGRDMDTRAAIHGRNGDMGREASEDDSDGDTKAAGNEGGQKRP